MRLSQVQRTVISGTVDFKVGVRDQIDRIKKAKAMGFSASDIAQYGPERMRERSRTVRSSSVSIGADA